MMRKTMLGCVLAVLCAMPIAAQSGPPAPNVNVVNTPTVQLAGTSTVQVSGTTNVRVQNDSTSPVLVQDVGKPKQTPFQATAQSARQFPFLDNNPVLLTIPVPAGKRLVIEQISERAHLDTGSNVSVPPFVMFSLTTTVAGVSMEHSLNLPLVFSFNCSGCDEMHSRNVLSQQVKLYADPGTPVQLAALAQSPTGHLTGADFTISGYLEDAP